MPAALDSMYGFRFNEITIKLGDKIVWRNTGTDTITLVSSEGIFEAQLLANDKVYGYIFNKTGTYTFSIKEFPRLHKQTIIVNP